MERVRASGKRATGQAEKAGDCSGVRGPEKGEFRSLEWTNPLCQASQAAFRIAHYMEPRQL